MSFWLPAIAVGSCTFAAGAVTFRIIRPRFPVTVECWFCQACTKVPYNNQFCWDCPSCEQYNGFSEDGDYNKVIPAQYREEFNHPITAQHRDGCHDNSINVPSDEDRLCELCNCNQVLKIRQLADFLPEREETYDDEIERYRQYLEHVYSLCPQCERRLQDKVSKQDQILVKKLQKFAKENTSPNISIASINSSLSDMDHSSQTNEMKETGLITCLRFLNIISAFLIFCLLFIHLLDLYVARTQNKPADWLHEKLHSYKAAEWLHQRLHFYKPAVWLHEKLHFYLQTTYSLESRFWIHLAGMAFNTLLILLAGIERLRRTDACSMFLWLASLLLSCEPLLKILTVRYTTSLCLCLISATLIVLLSFINATRSRKSYHSQRRLMRRRMSRKSLKTSTPLTGSPVTMSPSSNGQADQLDSFFNVATCGAASLENLESISISGKKSTPNKYHLKAFGAFGNTNELVESRPDTYTNLKNISPNQLRRRKTLLRPATFQPNHPGTFGHVSSDISPGFHSASLFAKQEHPGIVKKLTIQNLNRHNQGFSLRSSSRSSLFSEPRHSQQIAETSSEEDERNSCR